MIGLDFLHGGKYRKKWKTHNSIFYVYHKRLQPVQIKLEVTIVNGKEVTRYERKATYINMNMQCSLIHYLGHL